MTTLQATDLAKLLAPSCDIASETGKFLLGLQRSGNFEIENKHDSSPVTSADFAASDLITSRLIELTPNIPVLTEEALVPWPVRSQWHRYWLVDPLDGTQEFIDGSDDFAVSIALVEHGQPVLGVIYWPAKQAVYFAAKDQGAWRKTEHKLSRIAVRQLANAATDPLIIALSRRQPADRILSRMHYGERVIQRVLTGSCTLKSCLVAEGTADCFYRVGETGEWDTAAAQVIVQEAGGSLVSEQLGSLSYNQTAEPVNPNFLVLGDPNIAWARIINQPASA